MRLTVAVAIGVLGGIGIIPLPAAHGLTFAVRNTEDSGAGSLRQAVLDANAAAGPDEIKFAPALEGQAIVLTGGPLEVRDSLSIAGPGPDRLLIRSDDPDADLITIGGNGISVELAGLALEGGEDGIQINAGTNGNAVTLTKVRVARQLTDDAVSVSGTLNRVTLRDCVLEAAEDNLSVKGVRNALTLIRTLVRSAKQDGIEIEGDANVLAVEDSTIGNNGKDPKSPNDGIDVDGSRNVVRLTQLTSSGNGEDGLDIEGPGNRVTIDGSTIAFNGRDGIKLQDPTRTSTLEIGNSIVAQNNGPDVAGAVTSTGYNLIGHETASSGITGPGDQVGTTATPIDARLGPLESHGGATPVHPLGAGSPAINAGRPEFTPPPEFDQRGPGFPRVLLGRRDIGAFEAKAP